MLINKTDYINNEEKSPILDISVLACSEFSLLIPLNISLDVISETMHTDFYVDDFHDKRNEVLFGE